ncbi:putative agmatine deiminase [Candidatus Desulfarcum epimagneticum]|uniref:Putative agmatine deiminase n=1 Tax=uncultured Desulfobacteraceae bacterium TaxID=218296 RepID=A0A484HEF0_9BACT|nr:putative agmatine deiminase [uncultured Desulfobacteraceae bacterium]
MLTRRHFLKRAGVLAGGLLTGRFARAGGEKWFMPHEGALHERSWMAFGASPGIWGRELVDEARRSLAAIARAVSRYEPVSMLVRPREIGLAREWVGDRVELIPCPLDDLWIRDSGPVFVVSQTGEKAAVDFNFNGWGNKQTHARDARVAKLVTARAGVKSLETPLVLEGGGVETDGQGTALIAESCVLNPNRNPGMSKTRFEELIKPLLGIEKIIWLPGVRGQDITDGHVDFYARFARPGVVLAGLDPDPASLDHEISRRHLEILASATDARNRRLHIIVIEGPRTGREWFDSPDFAAGYMGFYVCDGAVIMQEFGDSRADTAARAAIQRAFPGRIVEPVNADGLAAGGGSVHCATQQEPRV